MKQVVVHGKHDVRVVEVPKPEPGPRDALVRVAACGVCGSDLHYAAMGGMPIPGGGPMALGHEFSGVVEAVGSEVTGVRVGARVAVRGEAAGNHVGGGGPCGGFAPYVVLRDVPSDDGLHPLPDSVSFELGALVEPLNVAQHAVKIAEAKPGERVVVFGAGPIGLSAIVCLRYRGVEDVVAVDLSEKRLELATKLGARAAIHGAGDAWAALARAHGSERVHGQPAVGSDVFIETTGAESVTRGILERAKLGARMTVVAIYERDLTLPFLQIMAKELTVRGSLALGQEFPEVIEMLASGRVDASPIVTHRFAFDCFSEAFETARRADESGKVMVTFPV
jgi:2-desacetyl-2-hydroxyethyl bacteriochlorophyllide A dehydrogenase